MLSRSSGALRGDPRRLGPDRRADRRDRAGARATCSRRCAPAGTSSPPTSSCSPSTATSCSRPPASPACSCASRARSPASCRSSGCCRSRWPGARIDRVHGIVNGTTNFILSEMARLGLTFEQALAEAQRLGYAEADPTDDVDGRDAAAKMAILARLAFGAPVRLDQVRYEGIRQITPDDMEYARELGLGAEADRHRRADRRGAVGPRAPGVPLSRPPARIDRRPVQRGHGRVAGDHRDHDVRPRRRRSADRDRGARRRRQRDDPAGEPAGGDGRAADRRRRRLRLLPAPRGRRRARRAGDGRAACWPTTTSRSSRSSRRA